MLPFFPGLHRVTRMIVTKYKSVNTIFCSKPSKMKVKTFSRPYRDFHLLGQCYYSNYLRRIICLLLLHHKWVITDLQVIHSLLFLLGNFPRICSYPIASPPTLFYSSLAYKNILFYSVIVTVYLYFIKFVHLNWGLQNCLLFLQSCSTPHII
jgi:hypothetical protein